MSDSPADQFDTMFAPENNTSRRPSSVLLMPAPIKSPLVSLSLNLNKVEETEAQNEAAEQIQALEGTPTILLTRKDFDVTRYKRTALDKLQLKLQKEPAVMSIILCEHFDDLILKVINYSRVFLHLNRLERSVHRSMKTQLLVDPLTYEFRTQPLNGHLVAERNRKTETLRMTSESYCRLLTYVSSLKFEPSMERMCFENMYCLIFDIVRTALGPGGIDGFSVYTNNLIQELGRVFRSSLFMDSAQVDVLKAKGAAKKDNERTSTDDSKGRIIMQSTDDFDQSQSLRSGNQKLKARPSATPSIAVSSRLLKTGLNSTRKSVSSRVINPKALEIKRAFEASCGSLDRSRTTKPPSSTETSSKLNVADVKTQRSPLVDAILPKAPNWLFFNAKYGVCGI